MAKSKSKRDYGSWDAIPNVIISDLKQAFSNLEETIPIADRDAVLEVSIVDRRTHERSHYSAIPYGHLVRDKKNWTPEQIEAYEDERESLLVLNFQIASDALNRHLKQKLYQRSDLRRVNWHKPT
jgi:hypothetical protein